MRGVKEEARGRRRVIHHGGSEVKSLVYGESGVERAGPAVARDGHRVDCPLGIAPGARGQRRVRCATPTSHCRSPRQD